MGAALGVAALGLMLYPGEVPGSGERGLSWIANRGLFAYFAPFSSPLLLALLLGGLAYGARSWPRLCLPLLVLVPLVHSVGATFDDYGFRHVLTALPALAAGLGALATARAGWPVIAAAGIALLLQTHDVADRYYASEEDFGESLDSDLPEWSLDALDHCALICEDGRVLPEVRQRALPRATLPTGAHYSAAGDGIHPNAAWEHLPEQPQGALPLLGPGSRADG